jgi:molecular chaperone GrpE
MTDQPLPPEQNDTLTDAEGLASAELVKLTQERDDWKDKAYRQAAEAENAKRRARQETDDAKKFAVQAFARDILPVADNLMRALQAPEGNEKALRDGVTMVAAALEQTLARHGVKKIEVQPGTPLNPDHHQAMTEVESDHPPGHVVGELQSGFTLNDRLLRPAMVTVSKKGPAQ